MFLDHTQRRPTVGRTPLDEWSACRRDLYLTTHDTHNRQTSMPPVGFEPTISAGERPQAAHWYNILYLCFFLSLYLIQIHIYEPIWTKFCTHLPLRLEETIGYVWSENVWLFLPFWPSSLGADAESSTRNGCRCESSATAFYPWFLLLLVWCHWNDVVADDSLAFSLKVSCTMGNA